MHRHQHHPFGSVSGLLCLALLLPACSDPSREDRSIGAFLEVNGVRGNPNGYTFAIDGGGSHSIAADGVGQSVVRAWDDGDHTVTLLGVVAPCTSNSPQTITFTPHVVERLSARFTATCP
jgi:hypothetical protein